jgi:hypothetical protein
MNFFGNLIFECKIKIFDHDPPFSDLIISKNRKFTYELPPDSIILLTSVSISSSSLNLAILLIFFN